jgi:TatD DNase family protein
MITIADSLEEGERCLTIATKYEHIFCTIGVHPHVSKNWTKGSGEKLTALVGSSQKVVAVGEIGLDYHYNNSPPADQKRAFEEQLLIAKELSLPAVVHCRDAIVDLKKIIATVDPPSLVIHCCTERWEDVESLVTAGHFLSFTGIATYPKADEIRRTIKECPMDQLMIETDAPYLAPIPHRGKRNEPAFVVEVAKLVAQIKKKSLPEVDALTTQNTMAFFRLPS